MPLMETRLSLPQKFSKSQWHRRPLAYLGSYDYSMNP